VVNNAAFWLGALSSAPLFFAVFWFVQRRARLNNQGESRFDAQQLQATKLQTLGELTASLTHEINNPLSALKGYSYQIAEELKSPELDLQVIKLSNERIDFNLRRIAQISNSIRSFARDGFKEKLEPVLVKELFDEVKILVSHHIKSAGVELEFQEPPAALAVMGSRVQIEQVLINLLSNAKDAVCAGTDRKIQVGFVLGQGSVELFVEDNGPGVSDALKEKIFTPFFTTKERGHGTGLGLYISQMIAERHNSELVLKSEAGKGARFSLRLVRTAVQKSDSQVA
jgi:C4-dicarboxylate-specific signal transduction histidine kinase